MYEVFNFSNRLTDLWWKLEIIAKEIKEIDYILEQNQTVEGLNQYRKLRRQFDSFLKTLEEVKESI